MGKVFTLILSLSFLTICKSQLSATQLLTKLPPDSSCNRVHFDGLDSVYLFGSCGKGNDKVFKFSIESESIAEIATLPTSSFHDGSLQPNEEGKLFLFGADSTVLSYDYQKNVTTVESTEMPAIIFHPSVRHCTQKNVTLILGGYNRADVHKIWEFNMENNNITLTPSHLQIDLDSAATICANDRAFVFPSYSKGNYSVWELNLSSLELFPILQDNDLLQLTTFHSAVTDGAAIYLVAGFWPHPKNFTPSREGILRFVPSPTPSLEFLPVGNWPLDDKRGFYDVAPQCAFVLGMNRIYCFGGHSFSWDSPYDLYHDEIFYIDLNDVDSSTTLEPTVPTTETSTEKTTEHFTGEITEPTPDQQSSETTQQSTQTTHPSTETTQQSTETTQQSTETTQQSTETMQQSTETTQQSTETMQQSTEQSTIEMATTESNENDGESEHDWKLYAIIGSSLGLILFIILLFCRRKKTFRQNVKLVKVMKNFKCINESKVNESIATQNTFPKSVEISPRRLKVDDVILGRGEFGTVFQGILDNCDLVAVKKVQRKEINRRKSVPTEEEELTALLSEAKIMNQVGRHPNIVQLLGVQTKDFQKGHIYVVVELCHLGSLESVLHKKRAQHYAQSRIYQIPGYLTHLDLHLKPFSTYQLLLFTRQVCSAMEFLASKHIVHGDLATRNVLLDENYTAKISDFGHSKKIYEYRKYVMATRETALPWRWLAPETLHTYKFSHASDCWTFGIFMWEVFSFAELPYSAAVQYNSEFVSFLENGGRLRCPKYATRQIHEVMRSCWNSDPSQRPSFSQLYCRLLEILEIEYLKQAEDSLITVDHSFA